MSDVSDATPAYRGYRLQALYVMYRILMSDGPDELIFQPEGKEDLSIYDYQGNLLEVCQVKAYSTDLVASDFNIGKPDSFFYRMDKLRLATPTTKIVIVSYGSVGIELSQALKHDGRKRDIVVKKLTDSTFISEVNAHTLLETIQIEGVDESSLTKEVYDRIKNSLMGIDADAAFGLLNSWLYQCSERKQKITRRDIISHINDIGRFLSERAAHHQEWGTTIFPIEDFVLDPDLYLELTAEFYRGVSTDYRHILANLDVIRNHRLNEIQQKFEESRIVIIHGASGQGKTTLALRYLNQFFPNFWRFRIQFIQNRQHALSLVTALVGHANALDMPIAVYLDASAHDKDWPDFARQLAMHRNIRLLITIREEDFQRVSLSGAAMQFSAIRLELDETEAQLIYQSLLVKHEQIRFVSFAEAWRAFGGNGPLMEFVYLVTQGSTLRERLFDQVSRLEDDVRTGLMQPSELQLLRLIAISSAYEARLKIQPLASFLGLAVPKRTVQLFEEEYLIRLSSNEVLVSGLHPIRSMILVELLTDSAFEPWISNAIACLPFICAPDLEIFLLHSFSRRSDVAEKLYHALLSFEAHEWFHFFGITRALIWFGIHKYVQENQQAIHEAFAVSGRGWFMVLDYDISEAMPGTINDLRELINSYTSTDHQQKLAKIQSYQTDKRQVFRYVREWLSLQTSLPSMPQSDAEWRGLAETVFWFGRLGLSLPLNKWFLKFSLEDIIESVPIDVLADIVAGLYVGYPTSMKAWINKNRDLLVERFRKETYTVLLEDNGEKVTTHFLVALEQTQATHFDTDQLMRVSKDRFHAEAIVRIELMRKLFPDRQFYASQGYGHTMWITDLPSDSTQKTGIPHQSLPLFWQTSINGTFSGLVTYQFRPRNWPDFVTIVVNMRRDIITAMQLLIKNLERYFLNTKFLDIKKEVTSDNLWFHCLERLRGPLLLPMSAVDEWGFLTESTAESASYETQRRQTLVGRHGLAIQSYQFFVKTFREYTTSLSNFFEQSVHALILHSHLGRAKNNIEKTKIKNLSQQSGIREDAPRLSLFNFVETLKVLHQFQSEFYQLLRSFINTVELRKLEQQERLVYQHLFELWYVFVNHPERVVPNIKGLRVQIPHILDTMVRDIMRNLRACSTDSVNIRLDSNSLLWNYESTLWIIVDGHDAIVVNESLEKIAGAIRKGIQKTPDSLLRQHILNLCWPYITVIPLVRGKSLLGNAWRWPIHSVVEDKLFKQWHFIQHPIPEDILEGLLIKIWDDPRFVVAQRLLSNIIDLSFYGQHIQDFLRLPQLDDEGVLQLQAYLEVASERMSTILSSAVESVEDLSRLIDSHSPINASDEIFKELTSSNLRDIKSASKQLVGYLTPQEEEKQIFLLGLSEVADWAGRLWKAQEIAGFIYLSWVSLVINSSIAPEI